MRFALALLSLFIVTQAIAHSLAAIQIEIEDNDSSFEFVALDMSGNLFVLDSNLTRDDCALRLRNALPTGALYSCQKESK